MQLYIRHSSKAIQQGNWKQARYVLCVPISTVFFQEHATILPQNVPIFKIPLLEDY